MIAKQPAMATAGTPMLMRLLLCVAAILVSHSVAAEPQRFATGFPQAAGSDGAGREVSDQNSVAFDELPGKAISAALQHAADKPEMPAMRGRKEIEVYRNAAPAVVLVITEQGLGSGIHMGGGQIITNWHVVGSARLVGVFFKPVVEGAALDARAVLRAELIKSDPVRDLALLRVARVPSQAKALEFGSDAEIQIGADVHAIGHPTGYVWTYTRGLISQVRPNYQWQVEHERHRASVVIQTQTPINPGNSGGPLIGDSGKLLGVNSFKAEGEGMNFAISVRDVADFIGTPADTRPKIASSGVDIPPKLGTSGADLLPKIGSSGCKAVLLYDGRDKTNTGRLKRYDLNCDGKAETAFWYPDDRGKAFEILIDRNGDGVIDVWIEDTNRDSLWDVSYYDTDFDGHIDLIGYHPDGQIQASRYERYPRGLAADGTYGRPQ